MRTVVTLAIVTCLLPGAIWAQRYEVAAVGGYSRFRDPQLGSLLQSGNKDTDSALKGDIYEYGVRVTRNTRGYYGHEGGYIRSTARLTALALLSDNTTTVTRQDRITMDRIFYNFLIYFMPAGERWRPFITAGAQTIKYSEPSFAEWANGASRNYGGNFGGGIKFKFLKHGLLRLDVRDYIGGKPYGLKFEQETKFGGIVKHLEASMGLGLAF